MRRFLRRLWGYLPFIGCWLLLYHSANFSAFSLRNLIAQLLVFLLLACLPALLTKKMSYVDVAWPWGLVLIGVQTAVYGAGTARAFIVSAMYIVAGLRMGVMALLLFKPGALKRDLPRYQYQRRRWEKAGYKSEALSMQYEILIQGLANASFLALPAMLQGANPASSLSVLELAGYALWALCFAMEHVADVQKHRFMVSARRNGEKTRNCDVGLWRYSRHPNYFFEWMVWNALILSSIPSLISLYSREPLWSWALLGLGLLFVSRIMYATLVYYTGAIPAEYYSVQKRPGYADYQKTTNMFFPGPPKKAP